MVFHFHSLYTIKNRCNDVIFVMARRERTTTQGTAKEEKSPFLFLCRRSLPARGRQPHGLAERTLAVNGKNPQTEACGFRLSILTCIATETETTIAPVRQSSRRLNAYSDASDPTSGRKMNVYLGWTSQMQKNRNIPIQQIFRNRT